MSLSVSPCWTFITFSGCQLEMLKCRFVSLSSDSHSFVSLFDSSRVLHQLPNARPSVRLQVEGGKQWGQRPWSTGGMSGGAEQADILSVLSLVKERWKVVSGVFSSYNRQRVCPAPSLPVPPAPNNNSLFFKQCFSCEVLCFYLWFRQFGVMPLCPGCCSTRDPKIACISIWGSAVCYRRQQQCSLRGPRLSMPCQPGRHVRLLFPNWQHSTTSCLLRSGVT